MNKTIKVQDTIIDTSKVICVQRRGQMLNIWCSDNNSKIELCYLDYDEAAKVLSVISDCIVNRNI